MNSIEEDPMKCKTCSEPAVVVFGRNCLCESCLREYRNILYGIATVKIKIKREKKK